VNGQIARDGKTNPVTVGVLMRQVVEAGADGMAVNFPDKPLTYVQRASREW
jgi:hypothetical protein